MRTLGGFCISLLLCGGLFAQVRGAYTNPRPITNPFGSVVFPGGAPGTPGVTRTFGSVVFPGSGSVQLRTNPFQAANPAFPIQLGQTVSGIVPQQQRFNNGNFNIGNFNGGRNRVQRTVVVPYAYPVYVGGYYEGGMQPEVAPPQQQQQQPPNVIVVYPQQAAPVYIAPDQSEMRATPRYYEAPAAQQPAPEPSVEPAHYLLAFKDHTVYSAVAYWVDGDTLHYFTSGNTHNQISISLVDRELTERLNKDSGVEVKLPPLK